MDEMDQGGNTARKQRWDPEEHQYTWGVMEKKLPVKEWRQDRSARRVCSILECVGVQSFRKARDQHCQISREALDDLKEVTLQRVKE